MNQPGYITGETLKSIDPPGQTLVISTWESKEAWQQWLANPKRVVIQAQIDVLRYTVWDKLTMVWTREIDIYIGN